MNDGSEAVASRLEQKQFRLPVGTSLAPTNDEQTMDYQEALKDYLISYRCFANIGSYSTLNLSCPNTCNDQPFTDAVKLGELLAEVKKIPTKKPLFLKLSPDLSKDALDKILQTAEKYQVDGLICTNLTKKGNNPHGKGGLSGKALEAKADEMLADIARQSRKFVLIGCGGIFSAEDAYRKIGLGASLVQLVTGMIYEGPELISMINEGLVEYLKRDGFSSLEQAIGKDL